MKVIILAAAVGIASASNILPRAPAAPKDLCCFTLTASAEGLGSAIVEEDTIGQNRVYSTYPDGYYCINPAEPGKLYDQGGRTCIISKTSQQFQCTLGLSTEVDFTVSLDGDFQADGSDKFWACKTGGDGNNADGSYLIYSDKKANPYGCVPIELSTTGNKCAGHGDGPVEPPYGNSTTSVIASPAPEKPVTSIPIYGPGSFVTSTTTAVPASSASASTVTASYPPFDIFSPPASSASAYVPVDNEVPVETPAGYASVSPLPLPTTTINPSVVSSSVKPSATPATDPALLCPPTTLIPGFFVAPALIIPVSPEAPDAAYGTQYVAQITPGNSTLFSFDIPADWEGSSCSLVFDFPTQDNTAFPGAWKYSGSDAKIEFSKLIGTIDQSVTYASKPAVGENYGETAITPGGEYRINTKSCVAGSRCTIMAKAVGDTAIEYFQATGPKAIGAWLTRC